MSEARIDRLMAAAIHQAIADIMPSRLEFYESYLRPRAWREDAVNLAPVAAVLSFLRHEPPGTYDAVMRNAADHAARWVYQALPWRVRAIGPMSPSWLRLRRLGRLAKWQLERSYRGTRVDVTVRRGQMTVDVRGSIFCSNRDVASAPHCRYYLAFLEGLLHLGGVAVTEATLDGCRARGGDVCRLRLVTDGRTAALPTSTSVRLYDPS